MLIGSSFENEKGREVDGDGDGDGHGHGKTSIKLVGGTSSVLERCVMNSEA